MCLVDDGMMCLFVLHGHVAHNVIFAGTVLMQSIGSADTVVLGTAPVKPSMISSRITSS